MDNYTAKESVVLANKAYYRHGIIDSIADILTFAKKAVLTRLMLFAKIILYNFNRESYKYAILRRLPYAHEKQRRA